MFDKIKKIKDFSPAPKRRGFKIIYKWLETRKESYKYFGRQSMADGFTMIELLVSFFIIAMMSGLFLVNYSAITKRPALINAAQQVASDIRLVQEYSLGSKEFNGAISAGGWGMRFQSAAGSNASYKIFADINGDKDKSSNEEFLTINLPGGIKINQIIVGTAVTVTPVDMVFLPPNPGVYFSGATNPAINSAEIQLSDGNTTKKVLVNYLGLIDVN